MKKTFLTGFTALSILFATTSCDSDDDRESIIASADLPITASTFVNSYFPNAVYLTVKKQNKADNDSSIYDIFLTNGFEIDFDATGNWINIDGNHQPIPVELIPEKINTYVTANYANLFVTSIDKEPNYTEVDLSNNLELIFDLQGNFLRIDK